MAHQAAFENPDPLSVAGGNGRGDQAARRDTRSADHHPRLVRNTHSCPGTSWFAGGKLVAVVGWSPAPDGPKDTAGRSPPRVWTSVSRYEPERSRRSPKSPALAAVPPCRELRAVDVLQVDRGHPKVGVITVTALTFSLTVVTLQLASSQFSPRLLRTFTRDRFCT
ncbi:MAG: hypothetical protein DLM57_01085 [Pseudonocardiales bacterium]|nr:MAG: hypothetical protein DLM57_01085 [Pseudonocardiales bacterium]